LPELSVVVVPVEAPLRVTVTSVPEETGLIVPEMLKRPVEFAVKFTPVRLAPLTVSGWLAGVKVNPVLVGVTV
jgi:hypothetical protein